MKTIQHALRKGVEKRNWFIIFNIFFGLSLIIFLTILILQSIILVNIGQLENSDAKRYAEEVLDIWDQRFIVDIIQTKNASCPQNYDYLYKYEWPGTNEGCNCVTNIQAQKYQYTINKVCSEEILATGKCKPVPAQNSTVISHWKNSQILCAKRDRKYSYKNQTELCEGSLYKNCGTKDNKICRQKNQKCPITSITQVPLQNAHDQDSSSYERLHLDQSTIYQINRYPTQLPISLFLLDQGDHCKFFLDERSVFQKNGTFSLTKEGQEQCAKPEETDISRTHYVDEIGENQLMKSNEKLINILNQLPGYESPKDTYKYKLYYSRFIQ